MDSTPKDSYQKILLVEDEKFVADLYAAVLQRNGFVVTCAYDGTEGLAKAQTEAYDLILLDIMLPGKSGLEVLQALRDPAVSPSFDQSTTIIILTNFDEDDITKKQILALAQAYLIKVYITPQTLANMLKDTKKGEVPPSPSPMR
jgi:DNA-binding response OmpR family regulator